MSTQRRTIHIEKIKLGSKFRTIFGSAKTGTKRRQYTYPTINLQVNPDWFKENVEWFSESIPQTVGGEASLIELYEWQKEFWTQYVTLADFAEFLFENSIFTPEFFDYSDPNTG